jgi:hypothetical protein
MVGAYQIANVAFSVWPIASQPWVGADPVNAGGRRYFLHPLGRDQMLHAGGDKVVACANIDPSSDRLADICFPHVDHVCIRGRDFRNNPKRYFGVASGFSVYEDGVLLCEAASTLASQSTEPSLDFAELAALDGLRVADRSLFGAPAVRFRITALRLTSQTTTVNGETVPVSGSPAGPFSGNYQMDGSQGDLDTTTFVYSKGLALQPGAPAFHQPFLALRIERLAADPNFPECELVVRNARGRTLLVYLPAFVGLTAGQQLHLFVADDGSTYFARGSHDAGAIDRNPNSAFFGAFLPRHLARAAAGQARPRPGLRPMKFRQPVYRPLCCWDQALQNPPRAGEVAFDPERGRMLFPAGEEPTGKLTASFRFAITGEVGAGPYFRGEFPPATLTVAKEADTPHRTIQAAINAAPTGGTAPVIIEILDSRTYAEAVTVNQNFPGGLVIRAAALQMPVLRALAGDALRIAGPAGSVTLDGLVVAGGVVRITSAVSLIQLRYCSLDPASSGIIAAPAAAGAQLDVRNTITGPVNASASVRSLALADSVVQDVAGVTAITASLAVSMEHVTVIGATRAGALDASNSILLGAFSVADVPGSCLRYSRHEKNPPAVRRFRCTTAFPIFASLRFQHPGYVHVTPNSASALRSGAEDGAEMGAFYQAGIPWREQNVESKLNEYIPAGIRGVPVRVLLPPRFAGSRTL